MRADVLLATQGYTQSRERAKKLILGGYVTVDGRVVRQPADEIDGESHCIEVRDPFRFVGRGGEKLEAALSAFALDPAGWRALDIGASTGGFTDCLLQHGAVQVVAVDSGSGQLDPKLLADRRVTSVEHCNARYIAPEMIGGPVRLIVMDVSFISATLILPRFPLLLEEDGEAVCLIKPQFEVGRAQIGKGGIVRDVRAHQAAIARVIDHAKGLGLRAVGLIASPILGGDGNREFLVHLTRSQAVPVIEADQIEAIAKKA